MTTCLLQITPPPYEYVFLVPKIILALQSQADISDISDIRDTCFKKYFSSLIFHFEKIFTAFIRIIEGINNAK